MKTKKKTKTKAKEVSKPLEYCNLEIESPSGKIERILRISPGQAMQLKVLLESKTNNSVSIQRFKIAGRESI